MPTPVPQPSAPEPAGKPAPPPAETPPPGPDAPAPKPAREGAIFRALVESGCDPVVAYTAEQRIHTMTSESAATRLEPVVAEFRQMRENMVTKEHLADFATKADLAGFATKADLAGFATKADLAGFATKADLAGFAAKTDLADFATKADFADLSRKIDVLAARLDGLKVLGQVLLGAFALLITALIAVFGFLFTN